MEDKYKVMKKRFDAVKNLRYRYKYIWICLCGAKLVVRIYAFGKFCGGGRKPVASHLPLYLY